MHIRTAIVSIILALGILSVVAFSFLYARTASFKEEPIVTNPVTVDMPLPSVANDTVPSSFRFEIANTLSSRQQGLSGRKDVPSGYGMLFVFDTPGQYGFWMKDMFVAIDIIWLADDGTILGIAESVSPETYPTPFYPPSPVRLVLETRVGEARAQGWTVGSRIPLPL